MIGNKHGFTIENVLVALPQDGRPVWIGRLFDCAVMHETKRSLHIRLQRVQPGSYPGAIAGSHRRGRRRDRRISSLLPLLLGRHPPALLSLLASRYTLSQVVLSVTAAVMVCAPRRRWFFFKITFANKRNYKCWYLFLPSVGEISNATHVIGPVAPGALAHRLVPPLPF